MVKSKTLIEKQTQRKGNKELIETITIGKKNKKWVRVVEILSGPRKKRININLEEINKEVKEGDKIVVPGKVLSQGEIDKKIKVVALDFSEKAKGKLIKKNCEILTIIEEIKKNPEAKEIKIFERKK